MSWRAPACIAPRAGQDVPILAPKGGRLTRTRYTLRRRAAGLTAWTVVPDRGACVSRPVDPPALPAAEAAPIRLPANAYTELSPGEQYIPLVPASADGPQDTWRSVGWGVLLAIVFTVAS